MGRVLVPQRETMKDTTYSEEMEAHLKAFIDADTSERRLALLFKTQDIMYEERLLDDKFYCFLNLYVTLAMLTGYRLRSK
jgi:hypothetical protein